ncbi:MAG: CAP domain-containing protein [Verrucomicrobiales bacterium]|nr:CAP domain-containing protein [Verrucomicrobiales bacterium]
MKSLRPLLPVVLLFGLMAPVAPEASAAKFTGYQKKLLRLHNEARNKRNLPPLRLRGALNTAAVKYALVMDTNNHFDHTGPAPDFTTFDQRIKTECPDCFTTMGENIAFGQANEAAVTTAWMKSPGHRRNILNRSFRFVGFGRAGSEPYWVTNFGG